MIKESIKEELKKWDEWRKVYEFKGSYKNNPLLKNSDVFGKFLKEYSVGRNITQGKRERLRKVLRKSALLGSALKDPSGVKLEKLNLYLSRKYASRGGERGLTSFVSKIAAFLNPDLFVAFDKKAKEGIKKELGIYPGYLAALDLVWKSGIGKQILKEIRRMKPIGMNGFELKPRFTRRVLDQYLMRMGEK